MVKTGLGIGIVPYQAIARESRWGSSSARVEGHELVRKPGGSMPAPNHGARVFTNSCRPSIGSAEAACTPLGQDLKSSNP